MNLKKILILQKKKNNNYNKELKILQTLVQVLVMGILN